MYDDFIYICDFSVKIFGIGILYFSYCFVIVNEIFIIKIRLNG